MKSINFELIKEKAMARGDRVGNVAKQEMNYRSTKSFKNCFSCELCRCPKYNGVRYAQCSFFMQRPQTEKDKSSCVDEFHVCDFYNRSKDRQNIKELLKAQ